MQTISAQEAQERLLTLIKQAKEDQCKYCITSPEGNAVLLSEETYENIMITLEMLSTPIFIENGSLRSALDENGAL